MNVEQLLRDAEKRLAQQPREVLARLQQLRATLTGKPSAWCVPALALAARAAYQLGDLSQALRLSTESVTLLEDGVESTHAAQARTVHGTILLETGHYAEAFEVLQRALARPGRGVPPNGAVPAALIAQGALIGLLGDHEASAALLLQAYRQVKVTDPATAFTAIFHLANIWLETAQACVDQGDDGRGRRYALQALECGENALRSFGRHNDSRGQLKCLEPVVRASVMIGDLANARAKYDETMANVEPELREDALAMLSLAQVERGEGHFDEALRLLTAIQLTRSDALDRHGVMRLLSLLVDCHERLGHQSEALAAFRQLHVLQVEDSRRLARDYARQLKGQLVPQRNEDLMFVAHDLIAPIEAVVALADGEPANPTLQRASRYARHALELSNQFLEILRLERIDPQAFSKVELGELVDDACDDLSAIAAHADKVLKVQPLFGVHVRSSREALVRAVRNLVINALKATPVKGTVQVSMQVYCQACVEIVIEDQGSGMPQEAQAVLMRSAEEDQVTPIGPRLGLRYVAKVMRAHQARVLIDAGPQGTRVTLRMERALD